MKRDIKFRVWIKGKNKIFDVIHIDYVTKSITYILSKIGRMLNIRHEKIKNAELVQYTGIKDITGKEIYEGDIVKLIHTGIEISADRLEDLKKFVGIIKYENGIFKIVRTEKSLIESKYFEMEHKKVSEIFIYSKLYDLEVIGNIFENKELLEGKNG